MGSETNDLNFLIDLVDRNIANAFNYWPNVVKGEISKFLYNKIQKELDISKTFFFKEADKIVLYFQIQDLPWDSNHFGYRCATIKNFYIDEEASFENIDEIKKQILPEFRKYVREESYRFLSADIASLSKNGNYFIQSLGFRFILNWIDGIWIPKQLRKDSTTFTIGNIIPAEINSFSDIAVNSYYKEGRFYIDKRFNTRKVDDLYGELIKNSFLSNDIVLTCREGKTPIGIFVCKQIKTYPDFNNLKVAHLRFLLVNPAYRSKSYGYSIFNATLKYLKGKCDLITTGLESHNLISLNLHSKMGFKFTYSHNAFHYWDLK